MKSIFLPCAGFVVGLVLIGAPLSCTIALELSTSGPRVKASALAFGRDEPPTPNATTPKPIEENINSDARIFFIGFESATLKEVGHAVNTYCAEKVSLLTLWEICGQMARVCRATEQKSGLGKDVGQARKPECMKKVVGESTLSPTTFFR